MTLKSLFILSFSACFIQVSISQCGNYNPQLANPGPQINLSNGIGLNPNTANHYPYAISGQNFNGIPAISGNNFNGIPAISGNNFNGVPYSGNSGSYGPSYPGYGGSGSGDVAVVGELPVAGATLVAGQVPVVGGVQFGGKIPAAGVITITGSCACSGY